MTQVLDLSGTKNTLVEVHYILVIFQYFKDCFEVFQVLFPIVAVDENIVEKDKDELS